MFYDWVGIKNIILIKLVPSILDAPILEMITNIHTLCIMPQLLIQCTARLTVMTNHLHMWESDGCLCWPLNADSASIPARAAGDMVSTAVTLHYEHVAHCLAGPLRCEGVLVTRGHIEQPSDLVSVCSQVLGYQCHVATWGVWDGHLQQRSSKWSVHKILVRASISLLLQELLTVLFVTSHTNYDV